MRRWALGLFFVPALLGAARFRSFTTGAAWDAGESGALMLARGDAQSWKDGVKLLLSEKHPLLMEEMAGIFESLPEQDRGKAADMLAHSEGTPALILEKLAQDKDGYVRKRGLEALGRSQDPKALEILEGLGWRIEVSPQQGWTQQRHEIEWLQAFTAQFKARFQQETGMTLGYRSFKQAMALGLTRSAGLDLMEAWIKKGSLNTDWRFFHYGPLESYPHPRAADILLQCARQDPGGQAGLRALQALQGRGDMRVFDETMDAAVAKAAASKYWYGGDVAYAAESFGEHAVMPLFEKLLKEGDPKRAWLWVRALEASGFSEDPETLKAFKAHRNDPRDMVRRAAREAAAWPRLKRMRLFSAAYEDKKGQVAELLFSLLALLAGVLIFLLAFRVLKLRALLSTLRPSPAGALAYGLARLQGEAQPAMGYLKHPDTGELCLYFPGADKLHPGHRFYLADKSGRVLVQPRGGLLLGGDAVITPGEALTVVGFAAPSSEPAALGAGGKPMALGKAKESPSLKQKGLRLLLKALLGFGARAEAVRMLFADPRDFFFIWEDQAKDPLSAPGTRAAAMAAMGLAGLWCLVFFTLAVAAAAEKLDELVLMGLGLIAVLI